MINVNELRIGNWVFNEDVKMSYQVSAHGILVIERSPDNRSPIPLTPEILEKAGFEVWLMTDYPGYYSPGVNGNRLRIWAEGVDAFCYSVNNFHTINLMYLHQLQNLYFALTGQELEVDLTGER